MTMHVGSNCEINACTNLNPWGIDTPAYCISDHLHCRQRNFSFQHNLQQKIQAFHFHIIHFLKSTARRGGHGPG